MQQAKRAVASLEGSKQLLERELADAVLATDKMYAAISARQASTLTVRSTTTKTALQRAAECENTALLAFEHIDCLAERIGELEHHLPRSCVGETQDRGQD